MAKQVIIKGQKLRLSPNYKTLLSEVGIKAGKRGRSVVITQFATIGVSFHFATDETQREYHVPERLVEPLFLYEQ